MEKARKEHIGHMEDALGAARGTGVGKLGGRGSIEPRVGASPLSGALSNSEMRWRPPFQSLAPFL